MDYKYIGEESNDYNDDTVIAILKKGGVKVTFIMVDDDLMEEDFDCLSWYDNAMVVGISETYLNDVLDESVADDLADQLEQIEAYPTREEIEEMSMKMLSSYLKNITTVVMATRDPERSSLDSTLERILEED